MKTNKLFYGALLGFSMLIGGVALNLVSGGTAWATTWNTIRYYLGVDTNGVISLEAGAPAIDWNASGAATSNQGARADNAMQLSGINTNTSTTRGGIYTAPTLTDSSAVVQGGIDAGGLWQTGNGNPQSSNLVTRSAGDQRWTYPIYATQNSTASIASNAYSSITFFAIPSDATNIVWASGYIGVADTFPTNSITNLCIHVRNAGADQVSTGLGPTGAYIPLLPSDFLFNSGGYNYFKFSRAVTASFGMATFGGDGINTRLYNFGASGTITNVLGRIVIQLSK